MPEKHVPAHVCHWFGVSRISKNWGTLGPRSLGTRAWLTQRKMLLPHVYYHIEFGRSRSNRSGIGRGS